MTIYLSANSISQNFCITDDSSRIDFPRDAEQKWLLLLVVWSGVCWTWYVPMSLLVRERFDDLDSTRCRCVKSATAHAMSFFSSPFVLMFEILLYSFKWICCVVWFVCACYWNILNFWWRSSRIGRIDFMPMEWWDEVVIYLSGKHTRLIDTTWRMYHE